MDFFIGDKQIEISAFGIIKMMSAFADGFFIPGSQVSAAYRTDQFHGSSIAQPY